MTSKDEKKKKKKEKKSIVEEDQDDAVEEVADLSEGDVIKNKKKDKKRKKGSDDNEDKKEKKKSKMAEKETLLSKLPQTNELGLPFTKIQIRKMLKRVKKGLPAIPSEEEQRLLDRAKKEEDLEVANLMFSRDDRDDSNNENVQDDATDQEDENDDNDDDEENSNEVDADDNKKETDGEKDSAHQKKARAKPVPDDYVCNACKNSHEPRHWIYDCPSKVTVKGTNRVKKNLRGVNDPDSRKVFISGLPYDVSRGDICKYFEAKCPNTKVIGCKTLSFKDTGRFNGQAYLSFETDDGAANALNLNGKIFEGIPNEKDGSKKKSKKEEEKNHRWLKVTKVLNRSVTKKMLKAKIKAGH